MPPRDVRCHASLTAAFSRQRNNSRDLIRRIREVCINVFMPQSDQTNDAYADRCPTLIVFSTNDMALAVVSFAMSAARRHLYW